MNREISTNFIKNKNSKKSAVKGFLTALGKEKNCFIQWEDEILIVGKKRVLHRKMLDNLF